MRYNLHEIKCKIFPLMMEHANHNTILLYTILYTANTDDRVMTCTMCTKQ